MALPTLSSYVNVYCMFNYDIFMKSLTHTQTAKFKKLSLIPIHLSLKKIKILRTL